MPRKWRIEIPIPAFLKNLDSVQFARYGRIHTKHVFNVFELERKASEKMLYRLSGKYNKPVPLTPEQISRWYTRIAHWSEESIPGKGTTYTPSKRPFIVYEFRQGKTRPLRSNFYYFEIRRRGAERGKANIMGLEHIVLEKERKIEELEKKKPSSAKKTTRKLALVRHNQKLHELYSTIVSACRLQLLKLEQLTEFLQKAPIGQMDREARITSIRATMKTIEARKQVAEREEFLAQNRILLLNRFPKMPKRDQQEIERLIHEMKRKGKTRDHAEEVWMDSRGTIVAGSPKIEYARAQAQLQYWLAFNTLLAAYMKAYHKYGTTLSKVEVEDIQSGILESSERIQYFKHYARSFHPEPG